MTLKNVLLTAGMLVSLLGMPTSLSSQSPGSDPAVANDVADHLSLFEEQAARVNRDADKLWSFSLSRGISWQSHAAYLNNLRDDINEMGQLLAELEQMKPQASEAQRAVIERVRPHLVALARETKDGLELVGDSGSRNLHQAAYRETVSSLSKQAEILYQTLDTGNDFQDADERLKNLEASHDGWEI